jgi:predicted O-linked N-acetylglucosamine transferase (SPINDLY family)
VIKSDFAEAHANLGNTLTSLYRLDEAEASYRQALEVKPNYESAFDRLLFTLNYHPDKTAEEIFEDYQKYDAQFGLPHQRGWQPHNNSRDMQRRLKVGYVSPDFRQHPAQHVLEPLLVHHDKEAIEVYAYAELAYEDSMTARYKHYADHWISTRGMSDAALAERIRADEIDMLVDLAGHTANNRLGVFARKPAPVSVSWLGYGYTTGLTAIDYYLADEIVVPENSERLFSETPWRMPNPGFVFQPKVGMGEINPLPAMNVGHVTFGCLSRGIRINHRVINVWSKILKRVEGARLVVDSNDFLEEYSQKILADKFAAHGISRDRLQFGYHSPPWDTMRGIDIGLDCFPHNSGTTLAEMLYMGLPFITLAERPSVGRIGSAVLVGIGHPEWVACSESQYVEIAAELASDLKRLAQLRSGLRDEMHANPLMDEPAFARKLEKAFGEMWAIHCEKGG